MLHAMRAANAVQTPRRSFFGPLPILVHKRHSHMSVERPHHHRPPLSSPPSTPLMPPPTTLLPLHRSLLLLHDAAFCSCRSLRHSGSDPFDLRYPFARPVLRPLRNHLPLADWQPRTNQSLRRTNHLCLVAEQHSRSY